MKSLEDMDSMFKPQPIYNTHTHVEPVYSDKALAVIHLLSAYREAIQLPKTDLNKAVCKNIMDTITKLLKTLD
jgi:hypothetical protein